MDSLPLAPLETSKVRVSKMTLLFQLGIYRNWGTGRPRIIKLLGGRARI